MDQAQIVGQLTSFVTQWGVKVVGAIAVLIIGRIAAGMIRRGGSLLGHHATTTATTCQPQSARRKGSPPPALRLDRLASGGSGPSRASARR
jgi:hypothetical protein